MLRRHLGYTPKEVDAMPWWELRMWLEKLVDEFTPTDDDDDDGFFNGEPPARIEQTDSLSSLGIVAHEI